MDTLIQTHEKIDLGAGPQTTIRVPDSNYTIDDAGHLHVFGESQDAKFSIHADLWSTVIRGDLTFNDDDDTVLVRRNR